MLRNYFKITLRNLTKNKLHTAILISGLSIGMAACLLILQYVGFELSFDQFHEKGDQIYRVVNDRYQKGKSIQKGTITYPAIGRAMAEDFPEILDHTRLTLSGDAILKHEDEIFSDLSMLYADDRFFEVFSFEMLETSEDTVLKTVNEIVLTESVAKKIFGITEGAYGQILGKTIQYNRYTEPLEITGVCKDVPNNSLLEFDVLLSYPTFINMAGEGADNSWNWSDFYHYLVLKPGTDVAALEAKFEDFSNRHFRGNEVSGSLEKFSLQALKDAHLNSSDLEYEIGVTANGDAVWSMLIIAFFILLIAWINYVNLSSVRAIERAKEVGIRKVIGAKRGQLMRQFLMEASVVNLLSLVIAFQIVQFMKSWFAGTMGVDYLEGSAALGSSTQIYLYIGLGILMLLGILLSGAYPAWLLSAQNTSNVLKGIFQKTAGSNWLRKSLVIFQFTASIALIAGTMLVYRQIQFMQKQDLGINIDQILVLDAPRLTNWDSTFIDRMNSFKAELVNYPNIKSATASNRVPGEGMGRMFNLRLASQADPIGASTNFIEIDHSYRETYEVALLAGRDFRRNDHNLDPSLITNVILNRSAIDLLGIKKAEDAIGKQVKFGQSNKDWNIVGVYNDFHQRSLHHAIEPMLFLPFYGSYQPVSVKVASVSIDESIAQIKNSWSSFFPGNAFEYNFLDDRFAQLYYVDTRFGNMLSFFTSLAILIACLGLLGLASYTAFSRTKEIGIRKVLGANTSSLVTLLSKDFLKPVIIATIIATPIAWYGMSLWLQEFHYRIELDWKVFVISGFLAIGIALLTISFQSIRAALRNPVDAIRAE